MRRISLTQQNRSLNTESSTKRFTKWPTNFVLIALVGIGLIGLLGRTTSVKSRAQNTVQAAGRGLPYFHFQDGREMQVAYRGDESLTAALRSGSAQPRSLAAIDLDRNGTPDVLAGYSYNGSGLLTLQRGNPDAFAPKSDDVFVRINQGYNPESLLPAADVIQIPEAVDFLQVGDFNHDNQRDVLVAANGGGMFLLAGDGQGGLRAPEQIALAGRVTALAAGEFRAPDGWTDVAVGISGSDGPQLLIFDGADGLAGEPMRLRLPAAATAVEFGEMDSSPFMGVAVATGSQIEIVHGWGRKQSPALESRVETIDAGGDVRGLATGFFIWNREVSKQLAALGADGTVRILQRSQANTLPFSEAELTARARLRLQQRKTTVDVETVQGWQAVQAEGWKTVREVVTGNVVGADATAQNLLLRAHVSFVSTDDLLVLGANQQRLDLVRQVDATAGPQATNVQTTAGDMVLTSLNTAAAPATALALPQKLNGERSLLLLQAGSTAPTVVPLAPTATIVVDRTDDTAAASACTGAVNDCSLRGAVQFANANPGTVITLATTTYVLNINGANGCVNEPLATGNTIGDLEVNATTTFNGNGAANTIIRQGAATNDRVLCMDVNLTPGFTFSFSGLTITGGRDVNSNVGGGGFIGGARTTTLNLTNVTFANNQTTGPNISGGGGVAITGGDMNVTSCTFGAATLPGANRNDLTLGNASNSNSAGGLSYSPGDPAGVGGATGTLTVTGSTFTHNTSSSGSAGGGGMDVFNFNTSTGTANISTSTFTSNQATGTASGGGINNESLTNVNISTTSFTSNSAGNRGGGVYVGGGAVLLDGTSSSVTFTGNTATTAGSSVSTASALNVSGTNTSIGGDIEVTTNGTWTNNAGSTLAPTNILLVGGTFTCNNSTMNVGGNLTIQSGAVVGGAFNGNTGTVNIAGNFSYSTGPATPTFTAGTNTFNFNGSGTQSISNSASITFNNLTDSNTTQPLTLNNSFAVNGTLNINGANAILDPVAAAVISGAGTLTGTGTARVRRTGADAFFSQYSITNRTLTNLTVEYIGAAAQTASTTTYNNLKINNASGVTLGAGNTIVNGTLTLTAGALNVAANTLTINNGSSVGAGTLTSGATGTVNYNQGSNGQSVLAGTYGNLTFSNFMKVLPSGTVGVAGTFTPGSGVGHTITGNTFDFNGTGAQTVPAFAYNNLTISGARGGATVTLASGTISVAGTFNPSATTVVYAITGNTFDFNGAGAQTVAPFNYNNLTISGNRGGAAVTLGSGSVGVAGTFSPAATNNTYVTTGNTVVFNGSALQSVPAFSFGGLTLNNAAGANLAGNVTVNGALTLTSGALGVGTNTLTLNGAVSATGGSMTSGTTGTVNYNQGSNGQATVLAANYGNLTFSNFSKTLAGSGTIGIAGTFTPGSGTGHTITGSTINFNGAGTQTIPGFTYNNLTSSGGAAARTLDSVNTIKIAGVFTPGTNVYTITGSTIEYNGTSAQTLPSSGFNTYNNLTLNNAAGTTGFAGLTVNGLIRVQAGTFTSSSTYNNVQIDSGATLAATAASTINVSGSWTNNGGTFTASTGTVNFNGGAAQIIGGTVGQTFNNLTNSNPAGLTMNFDNTVNGILALTSGDITVSATKTLTQPVGGSSSGGFDVNGRVQRTGFVTAGAALSFGNPFNFIQVTAGPAPANIVVDLARSAPSGFANAVLRTYTITPSAGGFTGTLRLHYLDTELNGNAEGATLILRRFNGTGWAPVAPSSFDTAANWVEKTGVTTFSPWTFSSCCVPTATNGTVSGRITNADGTGVAGAVINLSGTQTRKTITDANGTYRFAEVDTSGFYTVTPSRANYNFSPASRSFSQIGNQTEAAFTGAASGDAVNPLDTAEYFVRQQYVDILGREPDEAGFNYWSSQILSCNGDADCTRSQRVGVAAAFFIENEFKQSGAFIYNIYESALGRRPVYGEYSVDRSQVVGGATLEAQKQAFAAAFVVRPEFMGRYQDNATAASFVDALLASVQQSSGVNLSTQREELISRYNTGATQNESRAAVLRDVTEAGAVKDANYNKAFVLVEYFGYLHRSPDEGGYEFWVNVLNNGDTGNYRGMVCSFITSTEYQHRFSSVVSHGNGECGR